MGLRDRLKKLVNKFSGEYSAAESEVRPDDGPRTDATAEGEVKVTRARLKRPRDAKEG